MVEEATAIDNGTAWRPGIEERKRMELIIECSLTYSNHYWITHNGGASAIQEVRNYLKGNINYINQKRYE